MNCKRRCGGEVWWNAKREQWVHYGSEKATCEFAGLPTNTLKATPEGDVHPLLRGGELPSHVIPDDDPPQPPSDEQVLHALDPDNPYDHEVHGL